MTTSSGHVPVHINPFVGRETELEQLRQFFKLGARLVTVAGPGGAGKTRMAAEFARRHVEAGGRVIFVDLTRYASVSAALESVLGVPDATPGALTKALSARVGGDLLLVLDNLEHVVEDAASIVPGLLTLPSLTLLGTSREPLRLGGEQVVRLGPLSDEEAFQLFEMRARSVIPEFAVGDQSRDAIAEIVDRVDRLPLAIELAASRVNVLSPQGLAERLTSRMSALKSKDRDRPERHRTVAATARWSWELLSETERAVLRQLTVFRTHFELKDAERVVKLEGVDALDVIDDLVDRSMLERGNGRALRLYGVIYGLAAAELESSGEAQAAFDRHASHFASLVLGGRRHLRGQQQGLLPELELATSRTHAALRSSVVAAAASIYGQTGGGHAILGAVEAALGDANAPRVAAELQLAIAHTRLDLMDVEIAATAAKEARELARRDGLEELEVQALTLQALAESSRGDDATAVVLLDEALAVARSASELYAELEVLGNLARVHARLGQEHEARDAAEAGLMRARGSGDELATARVLANIGRWHVSAGRWTEAIVPLTEAIDLLSGLDENRTLSSACLALANANVAVGQTDKARGLYVRADRIARDHGQTGVRLDALIGLGSLRESASDRVYLVKAVDLAVTSGLQAEELVARSLLMLFDMRFGAFPLARHQARRLMTSPEVPEGWRTAVSALSELTAGWSGEATTLPNVGSGDVWGEALLRLVGAMIVAGNATGTDAAPAIMVVRDRLEELEAAVPSPELVRWPTAHVADILRAVIDERFARLEVPTLRLHPEGRFFQPPGGEVVDFSRRGALRRILVGLGQARQERPGCALGLEEVLEVGWPGEIVTPDAGASRVYSAVRTLRNNGLEEVLQTSDEGYFFSPSVAVVFDENLGR